MDPSEPARRAPAPLRPRPCAWQPACDLDSRQDCPGRARSRRRRQPGSGSRRGTRAPVHAGHRCITTGAVVLGRPRLVALRSAQRNGRSMSSPKRLSPTLRSPHRHPATPSPAPVASRRRPPAPSRRARAAESARHITTSRRANPTPRCTPTPSRPGSGRIPPVFRPPRRLSALRLLRPQLASSPRPTSPIGRPTPPSLNACHYGPPRRRDHRKGQRGRSGVARLQPLSVRSHGLARLPRPPARSPRYPDQRIAQP